MSALNNSLLLGQEGGGGYAISRSLRFNSSDSAYLSRTPASAGNRKTWTWAGWVKGIATARFFSAGVTVSNDTAFGIRDQVFDCFNRTGGSINCRLITTSFYRDPSAWFHVVFVWNTTSSTASDRAQIWVNGSRITNFSTATYPPQNTDSHVNNTVTNYVGSQDLTEYFAGLLADIHFIDGQALDPTSFGEFSATTGVWMPKAYTGTYGTNGFHLDFSNNASAAALGTDTSGNGNTWTPNNLSVTAGAGNDSLVDVPTNGSEVDTGSGGQVRGNYCTANPLAANGGATFSNGNLDVATPTDNNGIHICTIGITSGKWYWESTITNANPYAAFGITKEGYSIASGGAGILGASSTAYAYMENGQKYNNSSASAYGNTFTTNDVIGVAFDADAGSLFFYKNGVAQNSGTAAFTGLTSGPYFPAASDRNTSTSTTIVHNFGARSFAYTAPSGFKALNTSSLPAPVVTKPSTVMDVKLYTGNGSTQTISGLGFSPDFVWYKSRVSTVFNHGLFDIVRGAQYFLASNSANGELGSISGVTAFNSDGFTVGNDAGVNTNGAAMVAWAWDAGSSTVTNTQGSISSQVRANASAGFSIVGFTGSGTTGTVGHGLGVAPAFVIGKNRDSGSFAWRVYHSALGGTKTLYLNLTNAAATDNDPWNDTNPTSSVISLLGGGALNRSSQNTILYCFAPVAGYSSFGSYTGNGSADGPFVYTGFRPRWILWKCTTAAYDWDVYDAVRDPYNAAAARLKPNSSDAEATLSPATFDILSNGFKLRQGYNSSNASGQIYIYFAVAESPFQYARAR